DLFRALLKADIWIATELPERIYTRKNSSDLLNVIEPLMIMYRAHEESKIKAKRISSMWETRRKLAREQNRPVGRRCPAWIRLTAKGYELIPERAETIRAVLRLAREGMGVGRILDWLRTHPKEHPAFGTSGVWGRTYLHDILTGREVLGEYQPRRGRSTMSQKKRPAEGKPISGYYPAVVEEKEWAVVQAGVLDRKKRRGRPGNHEANLFTGIVYEAETREKMCVRTIHHGRREESKRPYQYLLAFRLGATAKTGKGLSYPAFERCVLRTIRELQPRDVLPQSTEQTERDVQITSLTAQLVALDHQHSTLEAVLVEPGQDPEGVKSLVAAIGQIAAKKAATAKQLEALKLDSLTGRAEALGEAQSLADMLDRKILDVAEGKAEPSELDDLRRHLKSAIRWVIDSIWVLVQPINQLCRIGHIQIYLRSGVRKYVPILPENLRGGVPWDLRDADFRGGDISGIAPDVVLGA
ncbi:MAG TPA: recombinase family protein, partial [Gemmataceae bacterium]|nr:recombinase family protein [Gemmataceae bacterium]